MSCNGKKSDVIFGLANFGDYIEGVTNKIYYRFRKTIVKVKFVTFFSLSKLDTHSEEVKLKATLAYGLVNKTKSYSWGYIIAIYCVQLLIANM